MPYQSDALRAAAVTVWPLKRTRVPMSLFDILAGFGGLPTVSELARQIAQRSYALVRESVDARTSAMTRAEARGYVWAKAMPVIRGEIETLRQRHPRLTTDACGRVIELASQRVVQSVLTDVGRDRPRRWVRHAA